MFKIKYRFVRRALLHRPHERRGIVREFLVAAEHFIEREDEHDVGRVEGSVKSLKRIFRRFAWCGWKMQKIGEWGNFSLNAASVARISVG